MKIKAELSYTLLFIITVGILSIAFYSLITPIVEWLFFVIISMSGSAYTVETIERLEIIWKLWPVYILIVLWVFSHSQGVRQSRGGGI